MSRRAQVAMTPEEIDAFLAAERTVICATNGVRGWPHLMPLWFVRRPTGPAGSAENWSWTYARTQKVRNLERDPRASLQVEAGESYDELRGVLLECEAVIHRDTADVQALGFEIYTRYTDPSGNLTPEVRAMVERQAPKRVALQFVQRRVASWDHRKLSTGVW
jgi:hypothetical protein